MLVNAISRAKPGACFEISKTVIAPRNFTMQMCVEYRDLNAQTENDLFPLPRIGQVWPILSKAKNFAKVDLLMVDYQIKILLPGCAKTVFLTH